MDALSIIEPEPPEGYIHFSEYSDDVGFKSMGQDVILSHHLDDNDKMYDIQCSLAQSDAYWLFGNNPLSMGYFLDSMSGINVM